MESHESSHPRLKALSRLLDARREEVAALKAIGGGLPSMRACIKTIEVDIALIEGIEKQWRDKWSALSVRDCPLRTEALQ